LGDRKGIQLAKILLALVHNVSEFKNRCRKRANGAARQTKLTCKVAIKIEMVEVVLLHTHVINVIVIAPSHVLKLIEYAIQRSVHVPVVN